MYLFRQFANDGLVVYGPDLTSCRSSTNQSASKGRDRTLDQSSPLSSPKRPKPLRSLVERRPLWSTRLSVVVAWCSNEAAGIHRRAGNDRYGVFHSPRAAASYSRRWISQHAL